MKSEPQIKLDNASIVDYNRHGVIAFSDWILKSPSMIGYIKQLVDSRTKFTVEIRIKHA